MLGYRAMRREVGAADSARQHAPTQARIPVVSTLAPRLICLLAPLATIAVHEGGAIAPALRPRCRALMAVRHADAAGAQAWLRLAEAAAEDQVDRALGATEVVLRDAIRGLLKAE
ncbi:hypothetical protein [Xanthomonas sp. SHU 199]|uniref:hypothetical protein n=1 Tax=Xanthomonas sp. SHU 199 TaxID=1591174 RepID=UPI0003769E35|nr:hypothetical protein [Xanthomonas sp. SHU 199]